MLNENKKQKQIEIRNKITKSAEKSFYDNGYKKATLTDISSKCGYTKRTIYSYFSSKKEIYFAVTINGYDILIKNMITELNKVSNKGHKEKLKSIGLCFWEFKKSYPHYYDAIISYENESEDFEKTNNSFLRKDCYEKGQMVINLLIDTLKNATIEKNMNTTLTTEQLGIFIWSSILGIFDTLKKKKKYLSEYYNIEDDDFVNKSLDILINLINNKMED